MGHPNEGSLSGALRVDAALPYVRAVSVCAGVDAQWGLPVLVKMIERAAREVSKRYPGSVLNVGDISLKEGGEIWGHHSHESGRDADIGFYAMDAKGKPLDVRSFVKFDSSLGSKSFPSAHFDVARNWLLVQHWLSDPEARVSHIFVAEPLRQSLLAHARARGVSPLLLNRAASVLMQPSNSLPHDDHFHVRISCPKSSGRECLELAKITKASKTKMAKARRGGATALRTPKAGRDIKAAGRAAVNAQRTSIKEERSEKGLAKAARRVPAAPGREGKLAGVAVNEAQSDSLLSRLKAAMNKAENALPDEPPALSGEAASANEEPGEAEGQDSQIVD